MIRKMYLALLCMVTFTSCTDQFSAIQKINKFDEKKLRQNDVNFLVSLNLLAAWEKSDVEYKRVLKLMEDPSLNFYPNLKLCF